MTSIDQLRASQAMATLRNQSRVDSGDKTPTNPTSTVPAKMDAVSLSNQGKEIGKMHQQLATEPSFNEDKVAAIKAAIANGSYSVDPERLADNMIKFEDELAGL
ncbi:MULTISPECIES: flagellar biosynthesis anti-sigma factor FlgM [unclassified Aliivibrio]|jgi:negative regulator of flagellin synthesis FlgM|uniref:flagellar biosynthesis anti-sigma factor FlgM n=1 Tax=unclassified Aliivibrio TaxID=2645654 RepID=UPI00080DC60D|nr:MULTISPECIES: flagellar biosynthesis anti-sigma factor FlgM [unclassified Aliivibrio]OCH12904.1 flagellar biosynthesis anti-sigma factor FlgM [Aliivibrio sp. 1S165]OCH24165.1 flagellar biosynthesis anti-sigma factor FlgM [Aliivibrio sp. 1S128]OCH28407.1 flagellar biosynthesis anti-sigma factor FlgM [Aliivibrio sp. 1S175]